MITASADFITAVNQDSRHFEAKILHDGTEVNCEIRSVEIIKQAFGDLVFSLGMATASQLTVVADQLSQTLENQDIQIQIGIEIAGGTISYITIGTFTVTRVRATTYQATLTGVGFIASKLDVPLPAVSTQTLANVASAIQSASGVSVSFTDGIVSSDIITAPLDNVSCRDALEIITSLTAGMACENASGNIEIHKFRIPSSLVDVTADRVITPPELAEIDFNMTGISVKTPSGILASGNPIRQTYTNDYMTDEAFQHFADNIIGYTFTPGNVGMTLGDPRIEPWDCLSVTDLNDNTYNVPCHQITHSFDGGFSSSVTAAGESQTEPKIRTPIMQRLDTVEQNADDALNGVLNGLTLETPYTLANGYATFTAVVYQGGKPLDFPDSEFAWYRKTEDYENYPSGKIPIGTGRTLVVASDSMVYGGVIRCEFTHVQDAYLMNSDGNILITSADRKLIARV